MTDSELKKIEDLDRFMFLQSESNFSIKKQSMSGDEIRLRCLEIAKEMTTSYDDMMKNAKEILEFVMPIRP